HAVQDLDQAAPGLAHAAQVGHRLDPVLALDPARGLDRALAGRAAGAVGDRDEVGLEAAQRLDGREQRLVALRRARWEELEREHWPPLGEQPVYPHRPRV